MKNKDITNILFVGVGGQGIILASDILCLAAVYSGFDAKKSEIHGMSQRGGSVFAHVRFGRKVFSPVIPEGSAGILVSLEEMETLRWLQYTKPDTKILFVKNRILPSQEKTYPEGTESFLEKRYKNIIPVDPATISEKFGSLKVLNVVLLGVISVLTGLDRDCIVKALKENVPEGTVELNLSAFDFGRNIL
jgi:indolepyruvate ferredoxin oxidoreductase beta subunit